MCPGGRWLGCGPALSAEEAKRLWVKGNTRIRGHTPGQQGNLDKGARPDTGRTGQRSQGGDSRSASAPGLGGGAGEGPRAWQSASQLLRRALGRVTSLGSAGPSFCSAPHTLGGKAVKASQPAHQPGAEGAPASRPPRGAELRHSRQELLASDKWRVTPRRLPAQDINTQGHRPCQPKLITQTSRLPTPPPPTTPLPTQDSATQLCSSG